MPSAGAGASKEALIVALERHAGTMTEDDAVDLAKQEEEEGDEAEVEAADAEGDDEDDEGDEEA